MKGRLVAYGTQVTCGFENRVLNSLSEPVFRLHPQDQEPCLCFEIDGRPAVLPLHAVASAMGVEAGSGDDEMLLLVSRSLAFRKAIRLGDEIPSEVTSGKASWAVPPECQLAASTHLRLTVLRWQGAEDVLGPLHPATLTTGDEATRATVSSLMQKAGRALNLEGNTQALQALLDDLSGESAYVDAVFKQFTQGIQAIAAHLRKLARSPRHCTIAQHQMTAQVLSMLLAVERKARTVAEPSRIHPANVENMLSDPEEARRKLRAARDALYRMVIAWTDEFAAWQTPVDGRNAKAWLAVGRLHRFVARQQITAGTSRAA